MQTWKPQPTPRFENKSLTQLKWTQAVRMSQFNPENCSTLGGLFHTTWNTKTLRSLTGPSESWLRGKPAQWKLCGRCGGGSACQRTLCRRTECQQASPGTFLFCPKEGLGWTFSCYCAGKSNLLQSSSDSRTDHSFQDSSCHLLLAFWFLCKPLLCKHGLSTQPPSNNDQLNHQCTAVVSSSRISLGYQDTVASLSPLSLFCCGLTVWAFCLLCLDPVWVYGRLQEKTRQMTAAVLI